MSTPDTRPAERRRRNTKAAQAFGHRATRALFRAGHLVGQATQALRRYWRGHGGHCLRPHAGAGRPPGDSV
ncbi:MAG: hypothetical protein HEQ37_02095 [Acidovorax sp.]|nr:hypothetical protein [Acidovorax sp.]